MKKLFLAALILVVAAQWIVPGQMIWKWEKVLRNGRLYKFQTQPVDPVNPIKGRYVALDFAANNFKAKKKHDFQRNEDVYIELGTNAKGYAVIKRVHKKPPAGDKYYLKAKVDYTNDWSNDSSSTIYLKYPFEEYFMDEFSAPKAERLYLDSAMKPDLTYALVKVYKGGGVIEDLYINNRPVKELILSSSPGRPGK